MVFLIGLVKLNLIGHGPNIVGTPVAKIKVMPGGSDLCFTWTDSLEDIKEHLLKFSVEIEVGPVKKFGVRGEGTSFYFRNLDGSLMEFIQYEEE